jgi:Mce-associated membrane protein
MPRTRPARPAGPADAAAAEAPPADVAAAAAPAVDVAAAAAADAAVTDVPAATGAAETPQPAADPAGWAPEEPADQADDDWADEAGEADEEWADEAASGPAETGPGQGPARRTRLLAGCLAAAVVILGGFGFWARAEATSLANATPPNVALSDQAATNQVRAQITATVNTIFSYNYANTGATSRSAQRLLTGQAIRQYNQLFALVRQEAPARKLIVTTRVTNAGVEQLTGSRARVLVFANQQDTIAGTGKTSYAGAMFAVTAQLTGVQWKIQSIDTFSGG